MSYDAQKVTYQEVTIFDRPALFTECRIDRATVPEGVYRYELRHGDADWGEPIELSRSLMVNFYGTVLTREPFQLPIDGWIPLESGTLSFQDGGCRTLAEFQEKYPASEKDVIDFYSVNEPALHALYFSRSEEQDKSAGCVGHLRGDFGSGKQFAAFFGLTPCPFASGTMNRDQGISKAGRKSLRKMAIECAWLWYRWQPESWLVKKWQDRLVQKGRIRRTAIVALARQLMVALWRYIVKGEAIEGAIINKPIEV